MELGSAIEFRYVWLGYDKAAEQGSKFVGGEISELAELSQNAHLRGVMEAHAPLLDIGGGENIGEFGALQNIRFGPELDISKHAVRVGEQPTADIGAVVAL